MYRIIKTYIAHAAFVSVALYGASCHAEGPVVYKETCSWDGFENWNFICPVIKNTLVRGGLSAPFIAAYTNLKSVTVCASFSNGGGLNMPAIVVHDYSDGSQSKPTELFDTIKFQGDVEMGKMSWTGTGPRNAPPSTSSFAVRSFLSRTSARGPFVYTEVLFNAQKVIGEIQAACRALDDTENTAKGPRLSHRSQSTDLMRRPRADLCLLRWISPSRKIRERLAIAFHLHPRQQKGLSANALSQVSRHNYLQPMI